MIAVDTNILVYAHRSETDLHDAATMAIVELAEGIVPWGLPVFCITEFLRLVTHRRVFSPPSTVSQALGFVDDVVASPVCRVVRPGPEFLRFLAETARGADARGNLIFDAQIAALCREHGIASVLTNDRDFERFEHVRVRYPGESLLE